MKFWDLSFCDCCYIRICLLYSPRMWRWSPYRNSQKVSLMVFSTYVEVILVKKFGTCIWVGILHVCGGDPTLYPALAQTSMYSPRMWRWSHTWYINQVSPFVFSTYVEVILNQTNMQWHGSGILHVCGGDPKMMTILSSLWGYSPRMWRWSLITGNKIGKVKVFSTYVEVILVGVVIYFMCECILHVCGCIAILGFLKKSWM